jgi:integrase
MQVRLKFINTWTDHLGRQRYRFRRRGFPRVELPVGADPNSPEFMAAYSAALKGEKVGEAPALGGSGTVANAIAEFLNSTTFRDSAASTQNLRRPMLNSVARLVGNLPLARMDASWIKRWLETASTVNVKRTRLLALKPFVKWALDCDLIETDPCANISVKFKEGIGHHTWTDEEIEQFRARHPLGTRARLALELLLGVALRRGDGISLGRRHLKNGWLVFTQQKNKRRKPMTVEVPMPPELAAAITACPTPTDSLTFLVNERGRPYSEKNFNDHFRAWCDEAGLPAHCVPHGLRKGGSRVMAEAGCSPHEIMAATGHSTLKEVTRYTAAYDRKAAAIRAQAKVTAAKDSNVVPLKVAR